MCAILSFAVGSGQGGVARILLQSPWETRRVAGKCISEVVTSRPVLAEWLLEDLGAMVKKVSGGRGFVGVVIMTSLFRVTSLPSHYYLPY